MRCFPVQCAVWTFSVVNLLEFIQDRLQLGDRFGSWACVDPEVLRVVETLDFALGLRVIWFPVLLAYPQCDQQFFEPVQAFEQACGVNQSVVGQGALWRAVVVDAPGETVDDDLRGDLFVHGAVQ